MKDRPQIPKIPHIIFRWYCRKSMYEELHGDLEEFYYERAEEKGLFRAKLLYIWDVIRCCQPYAWKDLVSQNSRIGMVKNYYFTAIRNLLKHKSYFVINISGLAIGIASFTFIALYIINELSYDRFHSNYENLYRVNGEAVIRGEPNNDATTAAPLARTLINEYPEVLKATRIHKKRSVLMGKGSKKISEEGFIYADSAFFDVLGFKLLKGNPKTALSEPRSLVLTQPYADKYFPDGDAMGNTLTVEEDSIFYKVTGIMEEAPANSHIQYDMIGSLNTLDYGRTNHWIGRSLHTYVVIAPGTDIRALEEKVHAVFYKYMAPTIEYFTGLTIAEWEGAGNYVNFRFMPIKDIHLYSFFDNEMEPTGNITYVYMYALIGIIILAIAIFNFVNLATAHSATRAREVGVRKVIGSTKRSLIYQFVFESILVSFLAAIMAGVLVTVFSSHFTELVGKSLAFSITSSYLGVLALFILAILVGVLAGFYPAFVLSAFRPAEVLKGNLSSGAKSGWLRNLLVTVQFGASIVIIIGTLVIYTQIDYMLSKNLGFDKEQMLVIKRPDWLGNNLEVFKDDLKRNPNIGVVANSETIPGKNYDIRSYRKKNEAETFLFLNNQVTYEHLDLMGLELVAGRFFSKEYGLDSNAVVLNESAVKTFGFDDPIGQSLSSAFKKDRPLTVIGVIKDYNIESLHKAVVPISLELDPKVMGYVNVKLTSGQNIRQTLAFIEDTWSQYTNEKPFQYFFFDEDYENIYKSESTTGKVLLVFATLSVFIACLGLVGLIAFTASVRKKEIGIRKILGASTTALVRLLSHEVVRLIVIATVIAWPLAYFATDYWLQNFADRIEISPWYYLISTVTLVLVVSLAISFQTIKASMGNPVESLRQE